MSYWRRGKNPQGSRTLRSYTGQDLLEKLCSLDRDDVNNLNEGDRIVYLGKKRTNQWAYEVSKFGLDYRDKIVVHLNRLTSTGKVSNAKNAVIRFYLDDLHWDSYEYYDGVIEEIEYYLEDTKAWYPSGDQRDSQKQRVYDSERAVKGNLGDIKKFDTEQEGDEFIQEVINSERFKKKFPDFDFGDLEVKMNGRMKHKARACYGRREINISKDSKEWGLSVWVLIHELAHYTAYRKQHNAPFTTHYADMIEWFDEEKAEALRKQFDKRNVDY